MSFILDALRKSETERQQQSGPGLANAQYRSTSTSRSIWIPLLVLVLAANAIALIFALNRDAPEIDATAEPAEQKDTSTIPGNSPIRPLFREVPAADVPKSVAISSPTRTGSQQPAVEQFDAGELNDPESTDAGTVQDGIPNMQQLVLAGQLSVQPLHLDIHVYSDSRSERFVFINMNKYREGDNLAEGPVIEEITKTGVILAYRGDRFTLDRD
jgi:general secretion pathway protein B